MKTINCSRCGNVWFDDGSYADRVRFYQCHSCGKVSTISPRRGQVTLEAFEAVANPAPYYSHLFVSQGFFLAKP